MAGGPYAAIVMCMLCTGKAIRIYEGFEDDIYQCEACGKKFGIDWSRGQPEAPCWPPSPEELRLTRQMLGLKGEPPASAGSNDS